MYDFQNQDQFQLHHERKRHKEKLWNIEILMFAFVKEELSLDLASSRLQAGN